MSEETREETPDAAEADASSEGSRAEFGDAANSNAANSNAAPADSPVLADAQSMDALPPDDANPDEPNPDEAEDLTGTAEWRLGQTAGNAEETAEWKPKQESDDSTEAADPAFDPSPEESPEETEQPEEVAAEVIAAEVEDIEEEDFQEEDEDADEEDEEVADDEAADEDAESKLDWYILKVASNREESIKDGLMRRARIAGLDHLFKEIIVPTETISEYKNGKRRTRKQKVWPGYLVVNMEINEDTWFLVRETPGIGDFTGAAGKPTPMLKEEVEKILRLVRPVEERKKEVVKDLIPYSVGDKVKIKEGTFQDFEGEVESVDQAKSSVTVMINIFGRPTPAEVSSWQLEAL